MKLYGIGIVRESGTDPIDKVHIDSNDKLVFRLWRARLRPRIHFGMFGTATDSLGRHGTRLIVRISEI